MREYCAGCGVPEFAHPEHCDPVVCVCERPKPDGFGECRTCRRPVLAVLRRRR